MTSAKKYLKVTSRIDAGDLNTKDDFEDCFTVIHRYEEFTQRLLIFGMPNTSDFKILSKRLEECAIYRIKMITQLANKYQNGNFDNNNS